MNCKKCGHLITRKGNGKICYDCTIIQRMQTQLDDEKSSFAYKKQFSHRTHVWNKINAKNDFEESIDRWEIFKDGM